MPKELLECLQALAYAGTPIGLILTYLGLRANARARKIETLDRIHQQLSDLHHKAGEMAKADVNAQLLWAEAFFNEVEYLSYLLKHGDIPRSYFMDLYAPMISNWEDMFKRLISQEVQDDPKTFSEFKELVRSLRTQRRARRLGPYSFSFSTLEIRLDIHTTSTQTNSHTPSQNASPPPR